MDSNSFGPSSNLCDHYTVDCRCGHFSEEALRENRRQCHGMRQRLKEEEEKQRVDSEKMVADRQEEETQAEDQLKTMAEKRQEVVVVNSSSNNKDSIEAEAAGIEGSGDEEKEEEPSMDFQESKEAASIAFTEDQGVDEAGSTLLLPPPSSSALQSVSTATTTTLSGDFIEEDRKAEQLLPIPPLLNQEAMDMARETAATALHNGSCCCRCLKSPSEDAGDHDEDVSAKDIHGQKSAAAQEGSRLSEEAMLLAIREAVAEAMSIVVLPAIQQQQQQQALKQSSAEAMGTRVKVEELKAVTISSESPPLPPPPPPPILIDPSCPDCVEYLRKKKSNAFSRQPTQLSRSWRTRLAIEEGSATSLPRDPRLNRTAELLLAHSAELQQAARDLHDAYIRPQLKRGEPLAEAAAELLADGERLLEVVVNPPLERAVERAADGLAILASFTGGYLTWLANDVLFGVGDGLVATAAALRRASRTVVHHGGLIVADLSAGQVASSGASSIVGSSKPLVKFESCGTSTHESPETEAAAAGEKSSPPVMRPARITPLQWLWKQVLAPPAEEQWQSGNNGLAHWPASTGLTEWTSSPPPSS